MATCNYNQEYQIWASEATLVYAVSRVFAALQSSEYPTKKIE